MGWLRVGSVMVVAGGVSTAWAQPARACQPDPCESSEQFRGFASSQSVIAPDGVIAFAYERGANLLTEAEALAYVQVGVVDEQGDAIAGTLEPTDFPGIAVWRPMFELMPGTSLTATVTVDNVGIGADHHPDQIECNGDIAFDVPLVTGADPLPPLTADPVMWMSEVAIVPTLSDLVSLVCCDGAYPGYDDLGCGFSDVQWQGGHCSATTGTAYLEAGFDFAELEASDGNDDLYIVMVGGEGWGVHPGLDAVEVSTRVTSPFCARIDVWSLARDTKVSTDEVCFGDEIADELGPIFLDPTADLEKNCEGEPYVCVVEAGVFEASWDEGACEPWSTGGSESSDGGSDDESTDDGGESSGDDGSGGVVDTTASSTADESGPSDESSSGGPGQDGVTDRGCSCSSDASPHALAPLGVVVLAMVRRRRRC